MLQLTRYVGSDMIGPKGSLKIIPFVDARSPDHLAPLPPQLSAAQSLHLAGHAPVLSLPTSPTHNHDYASPRHSLRAIRLCTIMNESIGIRASQDDQRQTPPETNPENPRRIVTTRHGHLTCNRQRGAARSLAARRGGRARGT